MRAHHKLRWKGWTMKGIKCYVCEGKGGVTEGDHDYGYVSMECPNCDATGRLTRRATLGYWLWHTQYNLMSYWYVIRFRYKMWKGTRKKKA